MNDQILARGKGCMLGLLAGDALGSLVEFEAPHAISARYPHGVRDMHDGGTFNTIAGQPTDDGELAITLARSILAAGSFSADHSAEQYRKWMKSGPFDMGMATQQGLRGSANPSTQANGAMMRAAPLGILGARQTDEEIVWTWAEADAAITHPHRICVEANVLFVDAIAFAIRRRAAAREVYERIRWLAEKRNVPEAIAERIALAKSDLPVAHDSKIGWVLLAFQIALHQLYHEKDFEEAVVSTVGLGGDTDTNAAICGALLGAVHGVDAIPERWARTVLQCRPEAGRSGVQQPRPPEYWPVDCLELATGLLNLPGA